MTNWKKYFGIFIIFIIIVFSYFNFIKKKELTFDFAEAVRGEIVQEVFETGQVKKGKAINLNFEASGRIEKIYVKEGQNVKAGDPLAKIETDNLLIQLQEGKANLALFQAKLNKLLTGATFEEIQRVEILVANAEAALQSANQNLENIKAQTAENLNASQESGSNVLKDASLKAENARNAVDLIQKTYFTANDQEGLRIRESKEKIIKAVSEIKDFSGKDIESVLSNAEKKLSEISSALKIIAEICQESFYSSIVSVVDKSSLETQRSYINTALTNVTNAFQSITSVKLANEITLNAAEFQVVTVQGNLKLAQNDLAFIIASPREEDVELYRSQVRQAEASLQILENQIKKAVIYSPVGGQVIGVKKQKGELVQSMLQEAVVVLLPNIPFEIEVDVYEEDILKIKVQNLVDISLIAFPDKIFKGKVALINPAEKIIEGVVYYGITIVFEELTEAGELKPGMTADLAIKTALKENVLIIPRDALIRKEGKTLVQILENKTVKEREITIGIRGSNNMVEVISGLSEGEKVILP